MQKGPKSNLITHCPKCKQLKYVIRSGTRITSQGPKQQFYCKTCKKYFRESKLHYQHYPPTTILNTISTYNLGHTISQTNAIINRKFRIKIPKSTTHTWLQRYQDICTFTSNLRKHYTLDPKTTIHSKKFHHQQVYEFKYHTLKTNITGKTFPKLKNYLKTITNSCPEKPFQSGPRCSSLRIDLKPQKTTKHNNAPKLAHLAQMLAKTNRERHQRVEDFFLINDSATIAIEVPVYLYPTELTKQEQNICGLNLTAPLSGHIDILQVRFNKIHILDYKPDATQSDKAAAEQNFLYALALSKRTKIPLNKFICAFFNDRNYFQFTIE